MKAILIFLLSLALTIPKEYPQTFVVDEVNQEADYITLIDFSGNIWTYNGAEDWQVGDIAAAIMDDNGTATVTDDTIKTLRYTGYID